MNRLKWYVHKNSKTLGPFSTLDLCRDIREGRLNWLDQAFNIEQPAAPGQKQFTWKLLVELDELRLEFSELGELSWAAAYGWVISLSTRAPIGSKGLLIGPFDHRSVIRKIEAGEISYSDHVWRAGFPSWQRLGDCADFSRSRPRPSDLAVADEAEMCAEPIVQFVQNMQVPIAKTSEERPPEADGDDLTHRLPWLSTLSIAALLFSISFPMASQSHTAAALEIIPLKLASDEPSLVFQTDAAPDQPIEVRITGKSGEILERLSLRKTVTVTRRDGELPTLLLYSSDAEELKPGPVQNAVGKIPKGTYLIEAKVGGRSVSQAVFIGSHDAEFESDLNRQLKKTAERRQREKMSLFYSAKEMHRLARNLQKKTNASLKLVDWRSFYASWKSQVSLAKKPLSELKPDEHGDFAFPDEVSRFLTASSALVEIAKSYNRKFDAKNSLPQNQDSLRALASEPEKFDVTGTSSEFAELTVLASRL